MASVVGELVIGPLAPFAEGFITQLTNGGYSSQAVRSHRGLLAHLSGWLAEQELGVRELTPEVAQKFLRTRRDAGFVTKVSDRGLQPLVSYLREFGVLSERRASRSPSEQLIEQFQRHQLDERGLAPGVVTNYARVACLFFGMHSELIPVRLAELSAADVSAFVLDQCSKRSVADAHNVISGLRALLRFLYVEGWTQRDLASAVPKFPRRRRDLPRALEVEDVARLLASCDRATSVGIRDYAILTVLTRLGVRASEVASLELRDVDWHAGEVLIRGKGPRLDRLPLAWDVGEAMADYLRRSRPRCSTPRLFIRSCAPFTGLSRQAVGGIVRGAAIRASLPPLGPHRLRHTVATGLLRLGASLPEIAQLLRHKSLQTTTIYAKVDQTALSRLALAWPGAEA
jgi:site-specific recombinase XerD